LIFILKIGSIRKVKGIERRDRIWCWTMVVSWHHWRLWRI